MQEAKRLRLGIIGANWNLIGHLPAWRELPGIEVVAICTSQQETAEAAAAGHNIPRCFWDWREMIADPDIDLIDVGTNPSLRQEIVIAAMRAGKHIYNASPFTTDMAKAKETLDVQKASGVRAAVDAQFQWMPQFMQMKRMIEAGYIGTLHNVGLRLHFHLMRNGDHIWPFTARTGWGQPYYWLGDKSSGASALRNLGGHALHILLYLFGPIASVCGDLDTKVERWKFPDREDITPDTVDTCNVLLRFQSGAMAHLDISWSVADGRGFEIEAYGSEGRLRLSSPNGFPDTSNSIVYAGKAAMHGPGELQEQAITVDSDLRTIKGTNLDMDTAPPVTFAMAGLFQALESAIRHRTQVRPSFDQAYMVQQIVEAIERSSDERRWIDIAPSL